MREWKDSYSVGFDSFDEDHKKLFGMLDTLESALLDSSTQNATILDVIDQLIEYAGYHFKKEEDAMARYNYPELEHHKGEHETFKESAAFYNSLVIYGNLPPVVLMMSFLRTWLVGHILKTDIAYVSFLKEKGFKG